jgi:hypothetical protein
MRIVLSGVVATGIILLAIAAFAQSPSPPADVSKKDAVAVPVPAGKRLSCMTASQGVTGQERRDQMQLCMAQVRLDCLKQAIDQKIIGAQRKDFVKTCVE